MQVLKIKSAKELESHLNFINDVILKEDDSNLEPHAIEYKNSYIKVIDDLILHDCLIKKE